MVGLEGTEFALVSTSVVIAANSFPRMEVRGGSVHCVPVLVLNRMVGGQRSAWGPLVCLTENVELY